MSSYWEHKKWSVAMSVVTGGVGAYLSRGTKLSRIGHKITGINAKTCKNIAKIGGKELFQAVPKKRIVNETVKRISMKVVEGAAYGLAQGAVDYVSLFYFFMHIFTISGIQPIFLSRTA